MTATTGCDFLTSFFFIEFFAAEAQRQEAYGAET